MSALLSVLPDHKLSEVQRAAIERIRYFQQKLRDEYGMYMRSGIELEFSVKDDKDILHPVGMLNMDKALAYLRDDEGLTNVRTVKPDGSQYEIIIGDDIPQPDGPGTVRNLSPVGVAGSSARLKESALKRMLEQTSCLNHGGHYSPVCEAVLKNHAKGHSHKDFETLTAALHINTSLYNAKGQNLFTDMPELATHCAHSLVELQDKAGLSMLPRSESLERLGMNNWAPAGLGMEDTHFLGRKGNYTSVNIREAPTEVSLKNTDPIVYRHYARIENRLPGADADPFVAMAVSMAAMVDAVEKNITKSKDANGVTQLKVKRPNYDANVRHEIPKTHESMVERFADREHEKHLKQLLGPRLYEGILNEYGAEATIAM